MISPLWSAVSEGNLPCVVDLLGQLSIQDIEIKDQDGTTPLIQAIKNGHTDIVRVLLDKGASPLNGSNHGPPESYTSDPAILSLLDAVKSRMNPSDMSAATPVPPHAPAPGPIHMNGDSNYPVPYYPSLLHPPFPDGSAYYPPGPLPGQPIASGGPLPPPEIARQIPCRYYPNCRFADSCMFMHPLPAGPNYYSGPPPGQYPSHFEGIPQPYSTYYPPIPPTFSPSTPMHNISPMSPSAPAPAHGPPIPPSDLALPPPQGNFPANYGPVHSPPMYPQPGLIPVPMSAPPLPPVGPVPAGSMYNSPPPFSVQQVIAPNGAVNYPENVTAKSPSLNPQSDGTMPAGQFRDQAYRRGGGIRRGTMNNSRRPPCLFFPAGKCKNGDECRFPHVMPDPSMPHPPPFFPSGRGGGNQRARGNNHVNGFGNIEQMMGNMSLRDNHNGHGSSGRINDSSSGRGRFNGGFKGANGFKGNNKQPPPPPKQRVPRADEFPVLGGSTTPLRTSGTNTPSINGPTAAQVLQAPIRNVKDTSSLAAPAPVTNAPESAVKIVPKLPVSFAAAAIASMPLPEGTVAKEVSVSA
ncbi:hypothetical protein FISHEDRAFT_70866 [Fistulina hepatica ATCC 64428]|uniref:C3H1-type domain-containing protein n=1 Tax=Fistulina hepatica ATCC 64428 TaxID=1128425 RepID=A0A0D7AKB8_9AGAR|nr:hypothetical protein FISHEDRAFT_70866 [Fistulina hepatica ATCC 64428]